jgi:hypothetical protein
MQTRLLSSIAATKSPSSYGCRLNSKNIFRLYLSGIYAVKKGVEQKKERERLVYFVGM